VWSKQGVTEGHSRKKTPPAGKGGGWKGNNSYPEKDPASKDGGCGVKEKDSKTCLGGGVQSKATREGSGMGGTYWGWGEVDFGPSSLRKGRFMGRHAKKKRRTKPTEQPAATKTSGVMRKK